ncbi:uncharacterized protein Z520_09690 [Fonsecaea multimorphosa CBS 102226]|uniref:Uncharacterized protein n=1 Tax=Fonsecaea multimorphosa CBS 102226 TaxID=1442371 RepID=A0A0D2JVV9_9EURO|nr:uncharacterized protein Z520_09690 [Fonsecaea multimorphosa CBS 102226]KIX94644.1 hypothetical protein Z520_09690 [Fonsecaea multimorphosa CBS 102226]OAL20216.1 hypothetical protein AYO22_09063 [Fonsecaea multimorphosa]
MAEKLHETAQNIVGDIKSGLHGIHGAGEALRGGAMEVLDTVFHKTEGEERNREIAEQGLAEMRGSEGRFEERHHQYEAHHLGTQHRAEKDHHHNTNHGQGSHFADARSKDLAAEEQRKATGIVSEEGDSLSAARAAMEGKY